ncbi:hypothetical protein [Clostridium sp. C2-6-12]|uniref:hypothetical protein n=1 Tax=Clostridium sp. C2-6-12 TaxID=2698832 RepID=UPI00136CF086|nr:hypothetical protein [Clostridium sp. C2-6-12]
MKPTYRVSLSFTLDKTGVAYNITGATPPRKYNGDGTIGILEPGFVYKIDTMTIYSKDSSKENLAKYRQGNKFYPSISKIFTPMKSSQNYTIDLQYEEPKIAMIKGSIKLDAAIPHFVSIQIFEIDDFAKESLLGSSFTDEYGNYSINFLIKNNYSYKLTADYISF